MFSVIFEVHPRSDQWDAYLGYAKMLRPELEQIEGFVDNIRYRSLTREGWILSLSGWRDEKALVRWRTRAKHHDVQVARSVPPRAARAVDSPRSAHCHRRQTGSGPCRSPPYRLGRSLAESVPLSDASPKSGLFLLEGMRPSTRRGLLPRRGM